MKKIKLGTKVRCIHTGFEGTAVARTEFINGCVQYSVVPMVSDKKGGEYPEDVSLDEQSLEVVKPPKKVIEKKPTGGPAKKGIKQKGF